MQVVGRQGCCGECIWILSRFVSFLRIEGGRAGSTTTSGLKRRQEKGAELEVLAAGIADHANDFGCLAMLRVARVHFVFPFANALGNTLEGIFKAVSDLLFQEVPLEGAEALDLFEGIVVPAAQGGFGDRELG